MVNCSPSCAPSALAERLADLYEERGRGEQAKEFRRQAQRNAPAVDTTLDVRSGGRVLRQKATITFGGEGLPLSELSNVAAHQRGISSPVTDGRQKVGRNEPCPCGSGRKFKK